MEDRVYVGISEKFVGGLRRPVRSVSNVVNLEKKIAILSIFLEFMVVYVDLSTILGVI